MYCNCNQTVSHSKQKLHPFNKIRQFCKTPNLEFIILKTSIKNMLRNFNKTQMNMVDMRFAITKLKRLKLCLENVVSGFWSHTHLLLSYLDPLFDYNLYLRSTCIRSVIVFLKNNRYKDKAIETCTRKIRWIEIHFRNQSKMAENLEYSIFSNEMIENFLWTRSKVYYVWVFNFASNKMYLVYLTV